MPRRLGALDRAVFLLTALAALGCATLLYKAGKDAGAIGVLGAAATLLSGYWSQLSAKAAHQAALLVPPQNLPSNVAEPHDGR